jgi:hypothetical protein
LRLVKLKRDLLVLVALKEVDYQIRLARELPEERLVVGRDDTSHLDVWDTEDRFIYFSLVEEVLIAPGLLGHGQV